jgi:hypothetical protein
MYSPFKCSQVTSTTSFLKFLCCIVSMWKKTSIGNGITPMHSFNIFIQNTTPMHSERVGYACLTTEKEVLDRKEKLTCLCFHHVYF